MGPKKLKKEIEGYLKIIEEKSKKFATNPPDKEIPLRAAELIRMYNIARGEINTLFKITGEDVSVYRDRISDAQRLLTDSLGTEYNVPLGLILEI